MMSVRHQETWSIYRNLLYLFILAMKCQKDKLKKKPPIKTFKKYLGINLTKEVKNLYVEMKHHYEQSSWRWWNSSWAISNPKRWCCENAALNMPANLENSTVATGLEKISFHSNPKERKCQRMFKLPHSCTHIAC